MFQTDREQTRNKRIGFAFLLFFDPLLLLFCAGFETPLVAVRLTDTAAVVFHHIFLKCSGLLFLLNSTGNKDSLLSVVPI